MDKQQNGADCAQALEQWLAECKEEGMPFPDFDTVLQWETRLTKRGIIPLLNRCPQEQCSVKPDCRLMGKAKGLLDPFDYLDPINHTMNLLYCFLHSSSVQDDLSHPHLCRIGKQVIREEKAFVDGWRTDPFAFFNPNAPTEEERDEYHGLVLIKVIWSFAVDWVKKNCINREADPTIAAPPASVPENEGLANPGPLVDASVKGAPGRPRDDTKFNAIQADLSSGQPVSRRLAEKHGYKGPDCIKNFKKSYRDMCAVRGEESLI